MEIKYSSDKERKAMKLLIDSASYYLVDKLHKGIGGSEIDEVTRALELADVIEDSLEK